MQAIDSEIAALAIKIASAEDDTKAFKAANAAWAASDAYAALEGRLTALVRDKAALHEEKNLWLKERAAATAALAGSVVAAGGQLQGKQRCDFPRSEIVFAHSFLLCVAF